MKQYTAHLQITDMWLGPFVHSAVLDLEGVDFAELQAGQGTWLSFGTTAESDDAATLWLDRIRHKLSSIRGLEIGGGYDPDCFQLLEHAPTIMTYGRSIVYSAGV